MKEVGAEEEDEWVDDTKLAQKNFMPIERRDDPATVVEINARMYPVEELYIDTMVENLLREQEIVKTHQDKDLLYESRCISEGNKPQVKEATMRVAAMLICDVIERLNRFGEKEGEDKKSVLVFLPGLHEIFEFIEFIKETYDDKWVRETFELVPLHSSLCEDEQDRAFRTGGRLEGKRKVIVATNIAESSITIPDVKYVIDFMLTKELNYDPMTKSESLDLCWVSKASAKQRAGRAGRVSSGVVFRLCPKRFYVNSIVEYPKPEMQRCPLEKLILQIKLWNKYEPEEILGRAI
jgi:HrpA-like RNA helicase